MADIWRPFSDDEEAAVCINNDINVDNNDNSLTEQDELCLSDSDLSDFENIRYKRLNKDAQQIVLNVYNKLLKRMSARGALKETAELTHMLETSTIAYLTIVIGLLLLLFYRYMSIKQQYWQKKGVYTPKTVPIIGHFLDVALFRCSMGEWLRKYYDVTNKKYMGLYIFDEPFFVVRDPEIINNILIKDFDHFVDRNVAAPKHDNVQSNMMFFQKNPSWRVVRTRVTPAFTTIKLKAMMHLILEASNGMLEFLHKSQGIVDIKEMAAKNSTNIIAKCIFGINSHCFQRDKAPFRENGRPFFSNSLRNCLIQTLHFLKPSWVETLRIGFFKNSTVRYFESVLLDTMYNRSEDDRYDDLVDIMKDLQKTKKVSDVELDDAKLAGLAINFFVAGFETTSNTIAFTLYELSMNKEIQSRLRREVTDAIEKSGGFTYESLKDMHYLNACINETLRKYPTLSFLDRRCNTNYRVPGTDVVIEKGTGVFISSYGLQMDANYFPNPQKFDPERFRTKVNGSKPIYLPFGNGPRKCIGERFGLLTVKISIVRIITKFELDKCESTPDSIKFDPRCLIFTSATDLFIKFEPLTHQINSN